MPHHFCGPKGIRRCGAKDDAKEEMTNRFAFEEKPAH